MTCAAHIPPLTKPRLVTGSHGFPEPRHDRCGQTVGLRTILDGCGQEWAFCSKPNHEADVRSQAAYSDSLRLGELDAMRAELRERARHEWEADQRETAR